jgi:hypothetical protein
MLQGLLGWVANSVTPRRTCIQKVHGNWFMNNKPGSHSDYAHHEVLPTRNACPQVMTLIPCGVGHFNKDVPHNVSQMAPSHVLILLYVNLATNQEKEFSESWIRVKLGGSAETAKPRSQNLA